MNWFVLALISSLTLSMREFFIKRNSGPVSSAFMSWGMNLFNFMMFLALNLVLKNFHLVTLTFMEILVMAALLDSLAMILYLWAIKNGQLSKIIPMLCFIPVVQLFSAPLLLDERLSAPGVAGVLIVVAGSYILNMENVSHLLAPVKSIFKNRSTLVMLCAACIWGVSSSLHKLGVKQTDAMFWGMTEACFISIFLFPAAFMIKANRSPLKDLKKAFLPSVASTITLLTYYMALGLGPVAYVSSIRRLGVLFSMVAGIVFFREYMKGTGFIGGIIMITGAVIISVFG